MPLPSSGPISLSQVNTELGLSATATISMGNSNVRTLFGVPSGAISMSNGYGKSNKFTFTISANQTDANLRTLAVNAGWNQSTAVEATIGSGVYISASSTGSPALTINGSFPGGVTLINNGFIVGRGGNGGNGGGTNATTSFPGSAGSSGGGALSVSVGVTINNASGTIGGGGGGGGGGAARYVGFPGKGNISNSAGGGGGGGGRSSAAANSSGGTAGAGRYGGTSYVASNGGTGTSGGAGGGGAGGRSVTTIYGGNGGNGGGWGSAGATGTAGSGGDGSIQGPYGGGSAGYAVSGNGNISWAATGTRLGSIS